MMEHKSDYIVHKRPREAKNATRVTAMCRRDRVHNVIKALSPHLQPKFINTVALLRFHNTFKTAPLLRLLELYIISFKRWYLLCENNTIV